VGFSRIEYLYLVKIMIITEYHKKLFLDQITQLLEQGHQSTTVTNTKRSMKTKTDADDLVIEKVAEYTENTQVKLSPVPNWVYDFVLKQINKESAIALLEGEGFVVLDPTIKTESETGEQVGMSDATYLSCYSDFLGVSVDKILESQETE
jgi:hypothetical protein